MNFNDYGEFVKKIKEKKIDIGFGNEGKQMEDNMMIEEDDHFLMEISSDDEPFPFSSKVPENPKLKCQANFTGGEANNFCPANCALNSANTQNNHVKFISQINTNKNGNINKGKQNQKQGINKEDEFLASNDENVFALKKKKSKSPRNSLRKSRLKEYLFKFTKRENIDKKIMRKFRKFLKANYKKKKGVEEEFEIINILNSNKFWQDFVELNLLPPFNYPPEGKEFKSFNTNYMSWIFDHPFSTELYNIFIKNNYDSLLAHFEKKYSLHQGNEEYIPLKTYINSIPSLFRLSNLNNAESLFDAKTDATTNFPFENNKARLGTIGSKIFKEEEDDSPFPSSDLDSKENASEINKNSLKMNIESKNFGSETKEDKEYTLRNEANDLENYLNNSNDNYGNNYGGYFTLKPKVPDIFNDIIRDKER